MGIAANGGAIRPTALKHPEEPKKDGAVGRIRFVQDLGVLSGPTNLTLSSPSKDYHLQLHQNEAISQHDYIKMDIGRYKVLLGAEEIDTIQIEQGGVYSAHIAKNPDNGDMGVIMFTITGLEFSYSQAPESMKSVLQACWLLTVAFGNIIDMIVFAWLAYRYIPREQREAAMPMETPSSGGV